MFAYYIAAIQAVQTSSMLRNKQKTFRMISFAKL